MNMRSVDGQFDSGDIIIAGSGSQEIGRLVLLKAQSSVAVQFQTDTDIAGFKVELAMIVGGEKVIVALEGGDGALEDQIDISDPTTNSRGKVLYSNGISLIDGGSVGLFTIGLEGEAEMIFTAYTGDDTARMRVQGKVT